MERLLLQLSEGISDVDHDLVVARLRMVPHPPRPFLLDSFIVTPRVPSPDEQVSLPAGTGGHVTFRAWKDQKKRFEVARQVP